MKTIVLMGVSCLMLAGVYGVMIKKSEISTILSFKQANNTVPSFGSDIMDKAAPAVDITEKKTSTSNTLDDSHWIDDPLFEKVAGPELITDNAIDFDSPQQKSNPETIKRETPGQENVIPLAPEVKQLILELNPDTTTAKKKVPVEVI